MSWNWVRRGIASAAVASILMALFVAGSCGGPGGPGDAGPAGGPVTGPVDQHCAACDGGLCIQPTSAASCHPDAGIPDGGVDVGYGPTMYNAEADDDDCKYHVSWSSTPVYENTDVWFTVFVIRRTDFSPVTGANTLAEVYLNDTHPAPNSGQATSETSPGTYLVGPVKFDAPGPWTARFHFRQDCEDLVATSPHGHAAFFVNVP